MTAFIPSIVLILTDIRTNEKIGGDDCHDCASGVEVGTEKVDVYQLFRPKSNYSDVKLARARKEGEEVQPSLARSELAPRCHLSPSCSQDFSRNLNFGLPKLQYRQP